MLVYIFDLFNLYLGIFYPMKVALGAKQNHVVVQAVKKIVWGTALYTTKDNKIFKVGRGTTHGDLV